MGETLTSKTTSFKQGKRINGRTKEHSFFYKFQINYKGSNAKRYDFGDVLITCIILNIS